MKTDTPALSARQAKTRSQVTGEYGTDGHIRRRPIVPSHQTTVQSLASVLGDTDGRKTAVLAMYRNDWRKIQSGGKNETKNMQHTGKTNDEASVSD